MTFSFDEATPETRAQVSKSCAHLAGQQVWIYRNAHAIAASSPHAALTTGVPVIVCFHGRLESCQDANMDTLLTRLAAATGAVCITFDNPNHGSRIVDEFRNRAWDQGNVHHSVDMYSQMLGACQDLNLVIDLLPGTLGIAAGWSSIAVLGISQGGHTSMLAASLNPKVDVMVGLIASGDYRKNMEMRHARMVQRYEQKQQQGTSTILVAPLALSQYYPPALEQCVFKYDPINNTQRIAEAAPYILLLNGKEDRLVPLECNEGFEAKLRPEYERRGVGHKLVRRAIAGVRHDVTEEMFQQTVEWLAEVFPTVPGPAASRSNNNNSSL